MALRWRCRINNHITINIHKNKGFSLLEILVAITIMAFLMTNVYTILSNSTDNKDRIIDEDRKKIQMEFAMERMTQDIEQIYSPLYHHSLHDPKSKVSAPNEFDDYQEPNTGYEASERFPIKTYKGHIVPAIDSPDKSSLIFLTASHRRRIEGSKESRYAWIKYELRSPNEDEKNEIDGDVLIRKSTSGNVYSGDHDWDRIKGYSLLKNVKELEFTFWNEDTKKFVSSPRELNEKKNTIRMIKIALTWIAPDSTELKLTRYARVLWPYYNLKKDEKEIKKAFQNQDSNNTNGNEINEEIIE